MISDLNMSNEKMSNFISFPLFGFPSVIELRNFDFESQWNTLIFFDKKYDVRFEYVPWKNVWFWFPLFSLNLVINVRKFDFESHWNTLLFFYQRKVSDLNMSC